MHRSGPNAPSRDLVALGPRLAEALVSVAADVALLADADGIVRCVAMGSKAGLPGLSGWVGRPWADTVAPECRGKIDRMRGEAMMQGVSRRCEVSHPTASGEGVPMAWTALRLSEGGSLLAAGLALKEAATAQQRLLQVAREVEGARWGWRDAMRRGAAGPLRVGSVPAPAPESDALLSQVGRRPFDALLNEATERAARSLLAHALGLAGGDRRRAAVLLGLDEAELERRLLQATIDGDDLGIGRAVPTPA